MNPHPKEQDRLRAQVYDWIAKLSGTKTKQAPRLTLIHGGRK